MNTNRHKWEPLLYSAVGVGAMLVILVAVGVITSALRVRLDLTADRVYTLSKGTRAILKKLDTPVTINFYCTRSEKEMPVYLKSYASRVEDLLAEYRQASGGRIQIKKFDPQPDSDAEDAANLDGVEGQVLSQGAILGLGEKVYLGLAVRCLDEKAVLPFLDPSREKLLEYDLTRAIARVVNPVKPILGVMSGLPIFGGPANPMMMMRNQQQGQEPWVVVSELRRDFTVKQVEITADKIDDDIHVLLVIHPASISDKAQFAIDQFVLRGGKLIAFLDPSSTVDSRNAMGMQNMLQRASQGGSSLDKLVKHWGLEFDINKVIADRNYVTMLRRRDRPTPVPEATWLSLTPEAIDASDVATSQIDSLLLPSAGVFTGSPAPGLTQTILLKTSSNAGTVDKMMASLGADTSKEFTPAGREFPLAVRLTGKFTTAFPDGPPAGPGPDADKDHEGDAAKAEADKPKGDSLKQATKDGVVVLVGDTDMLYDEFCVQVGNLFGQRIVQPFNGNLNFVQNLVEHLMGDDNLIGIRSRAVQNRPFTLVRKIQAQAEDRYREKIKSLEKDLQDTQQKLNDLQQAKAGDGSQRAILTSEQQAEIKRFNLKKAQVNKELKDVRKQLRQDIDSLETRLKWINIAGMPFLVAAGGLSLWLVKRKQTAAK